MSRNALVVVVLSIAVGAVLAVPARAGTYVVRACGPDGANRAFAAGVTRGMQAFATCPATEENGTGTGIVARAEPNGGGGLVPLHSSAWQVFQAPPGATLQSMSFSASSGRGSGCWSVGIWGWDGDAFHPGDHLWGFDADCSQTPGGYTRFLGPIAVDLRGHSRMRFGVRCDSGGGCPTDHPVMTWQSMSNVAVTVRDDSRPTISPTGGALLDDGWHRGTELGWAWYSDNVGVKFVHGQLDGVHNFSLQDFSDPGWPDWVRCDFARPRPCQDLAAAVTLDTTTVVDGAHTVRLAAYDAAGNPETHDHAIRVDNHAPLAPRGIDVRGGVAWRAANGFDLVWTNPTGQVAPIARAHWRLCRAAGSECRTQATDGHDRATLDGVRVPAAGEWGLSVWLADEAGNADEALAADPVRLRLDDVAPESPGFDLLDPADPLRVSLPASDRHSGLAGARIELRPRGGDWRVLPTRLDGDRATARIPDTELRDGPHDLRAVLRDQVGNERTVEADRTGRAMTVLLPLRTVTRLRVRAARPLRLAFAATGRLAGVLETALGRPVPGAAIAVSERTRTQTAWRAVTTATPDSAGAFALPIAAGPSRTLRLTYAGSDATLPATLEQRVLVPAAATLTADRRHVRNGARVMFSGRLRGRPVPRGGRTVDLQAHYRGAWRTFATPRTDSAGRWRFPYRFGATRGRVVYRFRALVKREAAYPYEQGASPTARVTVTG
jgi:hypothetical protein